jgi:hypothetical protein
MRLHATRRAAIAQARGLGNPLWDLAGVPASLDQRFAESKSLVDAVSGQQLITFTRASDGAVVNSAGQIEIVAANVPRFTHDPVTGESLGLLVEEQRTNSLTYSEDFTNAAWVPLLAAVTGNAIAAPDGATTADKLVSNNASQGQITHTVAMAASTVFTYSVFAKKAEWNFLLLRLRGNDGVDSGAYFNLTSGLVGTVESGNTATIQALANGWYRCSVARTSGAGATAPRQRLIATNADNTWSIGDGTSGIYLWGAQLEAGAFPTSYIPTTATAVTRSADVASITGSAFSSFYNQSQFTVYMDIVRSYSGNFPAFPNFASFSDGTSANNIVLYGTQNNQNITNFGLTANGAVQNDFVARPSNFPGPNLVAQALATNSSMFAVNGVLTTEDTSIAMPVGVNQLRIGSDRNGLAQWGGPIRRLCFWPQRLPNSTLQNITL